MLNLKDVLIGNNQRLDLMTSIDMETDIAGYWREVAFHEDNVGGWSDIASAFGYSSNEQRFVSRNAPYLEIVRCCVPEICHSDIITTLWFTPKISKSYSIPYQIGKVVIQEPDTAEMFLYSDKNDKKGSIVSYFSEKDDDIDFAGYWFGNTVDGVTHLESRQFFKDTGEMLLNYYLFESETGTLITRVGRVYKRYYKPQMRAEYANFSHDCLFNKNKLNQEMNDVISFRDHSKEKVLDTNFSELVLDLSSLKVKSIENIKVQEESSREPLLCRIKYPAKMKKHLLRIQDHFNCKTAVELG